MRPDSDGRQRTSNSMMIGQRTGLPHLRRRCYSHYCGIHSRLSEADVMQEGPRLLPQHPGHLLGKGLMPSLLHTPSTTPGQVIWAVERGIRRAVGHDGHMITQKRG